MSIYTQKPASNRVRILLAESNEIVRNGLKLSLTQQGGFEITGEVSSGRQTLKLLGEGVKAEIMLLDVYDTGEVDVHLLGEVKRISPATSIIAFTEKRELNDVINAFRAGVDGYLLKNISAAELLFGIEQIHHKKRYLCTELSAMAIDKIINGYFAPAMNSLTEIDFSNRELEVLKLMGNGLTNQEIADKLFTSRRTVEGHRQSLIDKTGVRNAPELIGFAVRNGIIA